MVHPGDATSLAGALAAARRGLIVPWLIGPEAKIRALAEQAGLDLGNARIEAVEQFTLPPPAPPSWSPRPGRGC